MKTVIYFLFIYIFTLLDNNNDSNIQKQSTIHQNNSIRFFFIISLLILKIENDYIDFDSIIKIEII